MLNGLERVHLKPSKALSTQLTNLGMELVKQKSSKPATTNEPPI